MVGNSFQKLFRGFAVFKLCFEGLHYFVIAILVSIQSIPSSDGSVIYPTFETVNDVTGKTLVCAQTVPSYTSVGRSRIDCAQQCRSQSTCLGFNVVSSATLTCQMYMYEPNMFGTVNGCTYYEVRLDHCFICHDLLVYTI